MALNNLPVCIFGSTHLSDHDKNPAFAKIGSDLACYLYLIADEDPQSETFAKHLMSRICHDMRQYTPYDSKLEAHVLQTWDEKDFAFRYTPDGMFHLGYIGYHDIIRTVAEPYKVPHIDTEPKISKTVSQKEQDMATEFPLLSFNYALHAQVAMSAGHSARFTNPNMSIRLADLLKKDAADRLIMKALNPVKTIQNRIISTLEQVIKNFKIMPQQIELHKNEQYYSYNPLWENTHDKIDIKDLFYPETTKISTEYIHDMAYRMRHLFGEYHYTWQTDHIMSDCPGIAVQRAIFGSESIVGKDDQHTQILFLKNEDAANRLAQTLKTIHATLLKNDSDTKNETHKNIMNLEKSWVNLKNGITKNDVMDYIQDCIQPTEFLVENISITKAELHGDDLWRQTMNDKIKKHFDAILTEAVNSLPKDVITTFNQELNTINNPYLRDTKLLNIAIENNNDYANITLHFINVPDYEKYDGNELLTYGAHTIDANLPIPKYYNLDKWKCPWNPIQQEAIDNFIDLYRKLYAIDNPFIRNTLTKLGLIKNGFEPVKYSEEKIALASKDAKAA